MSRFRFSLLALMILIAVVAVIMAMKTNRDRQVAATKKIYDAQKGVVAEVSDDFVNNLRKEGWKVRDKSQGVGGSGEWRITIALACQDRDGQWQACYVEVMGSVSEGSSGQPDWLNILPLRISSLGNRLNQAFIRELVIALDKQGWSLTRDTNLHDSPLRIL